MLYLSLNSSQHNFAKRLTSYLPFFVSIFAQRRRTNASSPRIPFTPFSCTSPAHSCLLSVRLLIQMCYSHHRSIQSSKLCVVLVRHVSPGAGLGAFSLDPCLQLPPSAQQGAATRKLQFCGYMYIQQVILMHKKRNEGGARTTEASRSSQALNSPFSAKVVHIATKDGKPFKSPSEQMIDRPPCDTMQTYTWTSLFPQPDASSSSS